MSTSIPSPGTAPDAASSDVPPLPPPAAALEEPRADSWRRLSPRMLLVRPAREVGQALPGLLALLFLGSGSGQGPLWALAGASIVALLSVARWFTTFYRVGAGQVQIREGLVRRRTLTVRLERIRTVDVTSPFLQRALGLARVEIGTGVSDRKGQSLLRLDGLTADHAARLRGELLHRAAAAEAVQPASSPAAGAPAPAAEVEIARLDPTWIRFAPFTLSGVFTGLAVVGFGWRLVSETQVDVGSLGPLKSAAQQLSGVALWLAAVEVVVGAVLFIAAASTVRYVLAYWGFRLTRHGGGSFHVARGLVTTRGTSIDVDRLRGVAISEPLLLRLVGGARTTAIATGLTVGRGASPAVRGRTVLLPDAPLGEAHRVAGVVTGRGDVVQAALAPHGAAAVRRRYTRAVGIALGVVLLTGLGWWVLGLPGYDWLVSVGLLVIAAPLAADRARNLSHRVGDGYLVTQSGSLARRRAILETDAIIGWNVRESFFQRRAGVLTLSATTAAGRQSYSIVDITPKEARRVAEDATPGLLAEFTASG